jgi:hypothetical protein
MILNFNQKFLFLLSSFLIYKATNTYSYFLKSENFDYRTYNSIKNSDSKLKYNENY